MMGGKSLIKRFLYRNQEEFVNNITYYEYFIKFFINDDYRFDFIKFVKFFLENNRIGQLFYKSLTLRNEQLRQVYGVRELENYLVYVVGE